MEINKTYEAQTIEKKWYHYWNDNGFFQPQGDNTQKPFTIVIPPPNVTGILHIGHVLNNTIQDITIRYQRMKQRPTLWIPGIDHAGIATQNVVEKELAQENKTRHDIGREELVKRIWDWKNTKGSIIIEQLKQLGCSCDWSRLRFTMDPSLSQAVKEVFIQLYQKDLIYKGKYIINWCPRCITALANDEVEHEDQKGKLWYFRYPLFPTPNSHIITDKYIVIATTRPETMLGDVAVAVNPLDDRYKHLIGQFVVLPITNRRIPIIADEYVDKDFGTGCVKITPAHDPNDFEIGLRHNLEQLNIMDEQGRINEHAPIEYQGLDRFLARQKIVEYFTTENLLDKVEEHENSVGHCYRCDCIIEPYLSDQWFVRMKPLAKRAIDVVETGKIRFIPERWTKVYMHWMNNIRDWCISRQIWWGHRIPAYYCENCQTMVVDYQKPLVCSHCQHTLFTQDEDVLDTWFSSWLWPFSTLGWPEKTPDLQTFLPTSLLITAPEIIYLWVARMIMATLEFQNKIPFDTVFLHGIVRDAQGRKMSKSLGNSPDPLEIIEHIGADALRFSIIYNTPRGQDSYYSEASLETGRNFCNKIWNAFRFIMMHIEKLPEMSDDCYPSDTTRFDLADQWIYNRLWQVTENLNDFYTSHRYNDAAQLLMHFIWDDYCSWYVEMTKEKFFPENDPIVLKTTKYVLLDVLQQSMRLLHPIMPFITEEIWQLIKSIFPMPEKALIIAHFPKSYQVINMQILQSMQTIQTTIVAIRNMRKQINISPATTVDVCIKLTAPQHVNLFSDYQGYICKLAKVAKIEAGINVIQPPSCLISVVEDMQIFLPLTGLVDLEAERNKLIKQKDKLDAELAIIRGKLNNEKFIHNAKPEIIEKEKAKEREILTKFNTVLEVLKGL